MTYAANGFNRDIWQVVSTHLSLLDIGHMQRVNKASRDNFRKLEFYAPAAAEFEWPNGEVPKSWKDLCADIRVWKQIVDRPALSQERSDPVLDHKDVGPWGATVVRDEAGLWTLSRFASRDEVSYQLQLFCPKTESVEAGEFKIYAGDPNAIDEKLVPPHLVRLGEERFLVGAIESELIVSRVSHQPTLSVTDPVRVNVESNSPIVAAHAISDQRGSWLVACTADGSLHLFSRSDEGDFISSGFRKGELPEGLRVRKAVWQEQRRVCIQLLDNGHVRSLPVDEAEGGSRAIATFSDHPVDLTVWKDPRRSEHLLLLRSASRTAFFDAQGKIHRSVQKFTPKTAVSYATPWATFLAVRFKLERDQGWSAQESVCQRGYRLFDPITGRETYFKVKSRSKRAVLLTNGLYAYAPNMDWTHYRKLVAGETPVAKELARLAAPITLPGDGPPPPPHLRPAGTADFRYLAALALTIGLGLCVWGYLRRNRLHQLWTSIPKPLSR